MKLCMFSPKGMELERGWPGRIDGDEVVQLAAQTLQAFFSGGGTAREHARYPLAEVELRPPVLHPPSVRDFYAFEQHVRTARERRGLEVPPEWYEMPVFYFSNPAAIFGPEQEIPYPDGHGGARLRARGRGRDGRGRRDRRLHGPERLVGPRPAAARDARRPRAVRRARTSRPRSGRSSSRRTSSTGRRRRWSRASTARSARAGSSATCTSRGTRSSRTRRGTRGCCRARSSARGRVGTGCILELGDGRWLRPGDVVELEVEGIGVLRNRVGDRHRPEAAGCGRAGALLARSPLDEERCRTPI